MAAPTPEKLKIISTLKREDGREFLREQLSWEPFDEEDDIQRGLHLDCLYDNVMFMIQKGFQWKDISLLFIVIKETLEDCKGLPLQATVHKFSQKLQGLAGHVSNSTLRTYTEFFFTTYMRHFKLYQYVFTQPQERLEVTSDLTVVTPESPMAFTEAKDLDVYDYERKYAELELQEEGKNKEHVEHIQALQEESREKMAKSLEGVQEVEGPLSKQDLIEIIHQVASVHVSAASEIIKTQVVNTMDQLDIMLEKTSLPRPTALGAPPRYKTKTPIPSSTSKRQASRETVPNTTSKSRQSSRAGKK